MWFWLAQHADRMGIQPTEKISMLRVDHEMLDLLSFLGQFQLEEMIGLNHIAFWVGIFVWTKQQIELLNTCLVKSTTICNSCQHKNS